MEVLTPEEKEKLRKSFEEQREKVDEKDAERAWRKGRAKVESLAEDVPEKLRGVWEDIRLMLAMLGDYLTGRYRDNVPWKTVAAIAVAMLYLASPIDLIPDFIPVLGYFDDAIVIALATRLIGDDLKAYRAWKGMEKDAP